jgi:guanosine-3',5'-bis(diphosphate) 3'-pyrophosphohydrolase
MDTAPPDVLTLLDAVAFAALAHRHQLRKDAQTPYFSHPIRVALVASLVFGVTDKRILTAAILHDTIEDTTTDGDDIIERFGPDVHRWVVALTKDKRLPEAARESAYVAALAAGSWEVHMCKLADIYDNLLDAKQVPPEKRQKTLERSRFYLDALEPHITAEAKVAFETVRQLLKSKTNGARRPLPC